MKFHLAELCCGSAALTLHYLGLRRQMLPYQGSKWRVRKQLADILAERDLDELGASTLNDYGPWGKAWEGIHCWPSRVIAHLEVLGERDPHEVYLELHGGLTPSDIPRYTAEFLFLQRLSYSGKAVGVKHMCLDSYWKSPGFNKTSAYGTQKTTRFGQIKPMIPSLIRALEPFETLDWPDSSCNFQRDASDVDVFPAGYPRVIYIDPNYVGSTGYPNAELPRKEVVSLARRFAAQHDTTVVVSEAVPVAELVEGGWEARCLRKPTDDTKPFQTKNAEWVTIWPPASSRQTR